MINVKPVNIVCTDGISRTGGLLTCDCGVTAFYCYLVNLPEETHLHYQCPDCQQTFCTQGCKPETQDVDDLFSFDPEAN
jgi:hypothetical protein